MESRACSTCGGRVDVMTVPEEADEGRSIEVRIGACERCGSLFNEDGVSELPAPPDEREHDTS
jgi:hypothetical protein